MPTYIPIEQGAFKLEILTGVATYSVLDWSRLGLVINDTSKEVTDSSNYKTSTGLVWANHMRTKTDWSFEYEGPRKATNSLTGALPAAQLKLHTLMLAGGTLGFGEYKATFANGDVIVGRMLVRNPKPWGGAIDDNAPFSATIQNCGKPTITPYVYVAPP